MNYWDLSILFNTIMIIIIMDDLSMASLDDSTTHELFKQTRQERSKQNKANNASKRN
jgi:hypothetical protein